MRFALNWFAEEMETRLIGHDDKGGWRGVADEHLLAGLIEECKELAEALAAGNARDIVNEAADVANFAMMIADNAMAKKASGAMPDSQSTPVASPERR